MTPPTPYVKGEGGKRYKIPHLYDLLGMLMTLAGLSVPAVDTMNFRVLYFDKSL
jgi:hypothetical protein